MKKIIYAILLLFVISSCSLLLSKMYGIKNIKTTDKKECGKFVSKIDAKNIELHASYIDSATFDAYRKLPVSKKLRHDLSQPVQVLFFKKDSLRSFHANCYAKGSASNLNWNTYNRFDAFLPVSAIPLDSAKYSIGDISQKLPAVKPVPQKPYTVIVIWTRMVEKISGSAIETVIQNIDKFHKNDSTVLYLLNNDDFYSKVN